MPDTKTEPPGIRHEQPRSLQCPDINLILKIFFAISSLGEMKPYALNLTCHEITSARGFAVIHLDRGALALNRYKRGLVRKRRRTLHASTPERAMWRGGVRLGARAAVIIIFLVLIVFYSSYVRDGPILDGDAETIAARLFSLLGESAEMACPMATRIWNTSGSDPPAVTATRCVAQPSATIRGKYTVLYNHVVADKSYGWLESVTFCTQATPELLVPHVQTVCERWQGPVSVAVYAPGRDFHAALRAIAYLRYCSPLVVREKATFHLFYETDLTPFSIADPPFLSSLENAGPTYPSNPSSEESTTTPVSAPSLDLPMPDCYQVPKEPLPSLKQERRLPYPINVARNIAREAALTHYILTADVELYPSRDLVPMFLKMVARPDPALLRPNPKVFVLPIFEVSRDMLPPTMKIQLLQLYKARRAVFFHKYVCPTCSLIPKLVDWLNYRPRDHTMSVFYVGKRHHPYHRWEPVYIGTNADPPYDERLTWEGRQDKMSQMHALCLMDYDLDILDNAFLVHSPGIKKKNVSALQPFRKFLHQNDFIHRQVVKQLNDKYGKNPKCK